MMIYLKLLFMAIFWGGTFIAGRVVAAQMGPYSAAFLRFALASVLLAITLRNREGTLTLPPRKILGSLLILGLTGIFIYNVLFFKSLKLIAAGRAAVIVATNPIFIALFSALFLGDKINLLAVTGILTSVSGALLVITRGKISTLLSSGIGWGEAYVFGCVASWVVFSLVGKTVMKSLSPLHSITYASIVGTVALFFPALNEGLLREATTQAPTVWLSISYLSVFGTVLGFLWYYEGIRELGPARAALFINFVPVSAVFLAYLIIDEPVGLSLLVGTVLVTAGVYLTNRAKLKTKES